MPSSWGRCPECGELDFLSFHRCKPLWHWRTDDDPPEEWTPVRARDVEQAAERAAAAYDEGDHPLLNRYGASVRITVRAPGGNLVTFECTGEIVLQYHARPLPPEEER